MKKIQIGSRTLCLLILLIHQISWNEEEHKHQKIVQISIPKCGTHLLAKCLEQLTGQYAYSSMGEPGSFTLDMYYNLSMNDLDALTHAVSNQFLITHLYHSQERADFLNDKQFSTIFIYRDPRDEVVSFTFFMKKMTKWWPLASTIPFDDLLLDMITQGSLLNNHPPSTTTVNSFYEHYKAWLDEPYMLCIRFEDLIGPLGGGSAEIQQKTIKNIAEHLRIKISDEQVMAITNKIFGNTWTFREGKIGSWKKYFKQQHIEAFKATTGNLLLDLGYEQDTNW